MALVEVEYMVTVGAMVDTESGTVTRVLVHDTSIGTPTGSVWVYEDSAGDPVAVGQENELVARAAEVAESSLWPAWEVVE